MSINWDVLPSGTTARKLREELSNVITPQNYGFGDDNWNLTELMKGPGDKKIRAFQLVSGDDIKGNPHSNRALRRDGIRLVFRLQILSRQACCRDKNGKTIVLSEAAHQFDEDQKIFPKPDDKPKTGDVVEWKSHLRESSEEHLSVSEITDWQARGIRMNEYEEFEVDSNGCIDVPFVFALPMLLKRGFRNAPRFEKVDIIKPGEKKPRRITNWWFKEIPPKQKREPAKEISGVAGEPKEGTNDQPKN